MPKILIRYTKGGPLKYLSHLELIRALERSFRRAGIEVQRSGGFHPRPKVSHGPALPVGVSSCAEYMLADLVEDVPEKELLKKISGFLPEGLNVTGAKYTKDRKPSIASVVQSACYEVKTELSGNCAGINAVSDAIERLMGENRLLIKHKQTEKWVETKKAILDLKLEQEDSSKARLYLLLSLGDKDSVRPEVAVGKLIAKLEGSCELEVKDICRMEQYVNRGDPLINVYNFYESVNTESEWTKS